MSEWNSDERWAWLEMTIQSLIDRYGLVPGDDLTVPSLHLNAMFRSAGIVPPRPIVLSWRGYKVQVDLESET